VAVAEEEAVPDLHHEEGGLVDYCLHLINYIYSQIDRNENLSSTIITVPPLIASQSSTLSY
jgi:hypothetical protein